MAIVIKADSGDTSDSLIRKFKKSVIADNLLGELRRRSRFIPKSQEKKEKLAVVRRQQRRHRSAKRRKNTKPSY